jgi:hypothetical protein
MGLSFPDPRNLLDIALDLRGDAPCSETSTLPGDLVPINLKTGTVWLLNFQHFRCRS